MIDYKIDSVKPEEIDAAVAAHRRQVEVYAEAASRTTGMS